MPCCLKDHRLLVWLHQVYPNLSMFLLLFSLSCLWLVPPNNHALIIWPMIGPGVSVRWLKPIFVNLVSYHHFLFLLLFTVCFLIESSFIEWIMFIGALLYISTTKSVSSPVVLVSVCGSLVIGRWFSEACPLDAVKRVQWVIIRSSLDTFAAFMSNTTSYFCS